jgi:hypothetical protein
MKVMTVQDDNIKTQASVCMVDPPDALRSLGLVPSKRQEHEDTEEHVDTHHDESIEISHGRQLLEKSHGLFAQIEEFLDAALALRFTE